MNIHFLYEKPIVELSRLRYLVSNKFLLYANTCYFGRHDNWKLT